MRILLIDDDPLVTSGLQLIIETASKQLDSPHQVVAIGQDGNQALDLYQAHQPDIVLMDIRMQEVNGIEAGQAIMALDPQAKIIYLTTFLEDDYIVAALRLGARGYLLKSSYDSIVPALEAVANNQSVFGDEIVDRLPSYFFQQQLGQPQRIAELTEKENTLLYHIAQGLNNKEIAEAMHFSEGTIRNYISDLLLKLDLRDRTQLAIYYYKQRK